MKFDELRIARGDGHSHESTVGCQIRGVIVCLRHRIVA
jgi:hypothetical protein